jgi:aminopeptidase N
MFAAAQSFTEEHAAMALAAAQNNALGEELLAGFHERHKGDALMLDKWFAAQARIEAPETEGRVRKLMDHPGFSLKTPNRVYALIRSFIGANFTGFHAADGSGYGFAADAILAADKVNPQVAARLATGFRSWRLFDIPRRLAAQRAMQRILAAPGLSKDVNEIISRTLAV